MDSEIIKKIIKPKPVIEGAGVKLKRVFGFYEKGLLDPFLLFDQFGSANPADYLKGFPWHPHRGIETVTYMLEGSVEHRDSLGNKGIINSGDIQWMTAGSGIIHQEMPLSYDGVMKGFQLWVNLPHNLKMTQPKYREVLAKNIPNINFNKNIEIKIISGEVDGIKGAIDDLGIDILYYDISIRNSDSFAINTNPEYIVFAYIYGGEAVFDHTGNYIKNDHLVLLKNTDNIIIKARKSAKLLLIQGKPLNEPIAWQGPVVMNTQEELQKAFEEYRNGNFVKSI